MLTRKLILFLFATLCRASAGHYCLAVNQFDIVNEGGGVDCFGELSGTSIFYTGAAAPWAFPPLRFGTNFTYTFPAIPGFYNVTLTFLEPNATRAGQRLFTISINGAISQNIDVWAAVGSSISGNVPYTFRGFAVSNGSIGIQFRGVVGNAIISKIEFTQITPLDIFEANIATDPRQLAFEKELNNLPNPLPYFRAPFYTGDMTPIKRIWAERQRTHTLPGNCDTIIFDQNYHPFILTKEKPC